MKKKQQTYYAKPSLINKRWFLFDATGKTLGRLSSCIASIIRGKYKTDYTPSVDVGDYVIVINSDKILTTGNKDYDKIYYRHSRFPGGLKSTSLRDQRNKDSRKIINESVRGMLPKNRLGRKQFLHLFVYKDNNHPHQSQMPVTFDICKGGPNEISK